jgi:hypothetical protein
MMGLFGAQPLADLAARIFQQQRKPGDDWAADVTGRLNPMPWQPNRLVLPVGDVIDARGKFKGMGFGNLTEGARSYGGGANPLGGAGAVDALGPNRPGNVEKMSEGIQRLSGYEAPTVTRLRGPIEQWHSDNPEVTGQSPQKYSAENPGPLRDYAKALDEGGPKAAAADFKAKVMADFARAAKLREGIPTATNEPSARDSAQTSFPSLSPSESYKAWEQQYGKPRPGSPSIDTPSMRASAAAGDARTAELEKFGAGMGLKPGTAQRIFNGLMLESETKGTPAPSVNQIKYYLTLLRQKGQL